MENSSEGEAGVGNSPEFGIQIVLTEDDINASLKEINGLTARNIAEKLAEARKAANIYRELAGEDPLTKLLNRRGLEDQFTRLKARMARKVKEGGENLTEYSVLMIDLVGVKRVNDSEGQKAGDDFILATADAINSAVRKGTDIAARVGGDEFDVVLPNTTTDGATEVARRIQENMPPNRKFNVVIGTFSASTGLADSVDVVGKELKQAKQIAPKDENGRSLGFGYVYVT